MKSIITGGCGFIGSHLAQALCGMGHDVVCVDNLSLGKLTNLSWSTPPDRLTVVEGDLRDEALLAQIMTGADWVFHEGALPSVPRSVGQPLESNSHNLEGTLKVLIAARDAGVKRLLFASSSSIYGDVDAPLKVETLPPNPLSPYALQKYGAEKYCQLFHRLYGLVTVALRYFNVFGPRQAFDSPYSGVIAKFCTCMLAGEAPLVHGDGLQARDFTYIDNVVAANLQAAAAPAEAVAGRVFNVASQEAVTLLELVDELNVLTGQRLEPQFAPARVGDIRHSLADISAAQQAFGYAVQKRWKTGLAETLEYYRQEGKTLLP